MEYSLSRRELAWIYPWIDATRTTVESSQCLRELAVWRVELFGLKVDDREGPQRWVREAEIVYIALTLTTIRRMRPATTFMTRTSAKPLTSSTHNTFIQRDCRKFAKLIVRWPAASPLEAPAVATYLRKIRWLILGGAIKRCTICLRQVKWHRIWIERMNDSLSGCKRYTR